MTPLLQATGWQFNSQSYLVKDFGKYFATLKTAGNLTFWTLYVHRYQHAEFVDGGVQDDPDLAGTEALKAFRLVCT